MRERKALISIRLPNETLAYFKDNFPEYTRAIRDALDKVAKKGMAKGTKQ